MIGWRKIIKEGEVDNQIQCLVKRATTQGKLRAEAQEQYRELIYAREGFGFSTLLSTTK